MIDIIGLFTLLILFLFMSGYETNKYSSLDDIYFLVNKVDIKGEGNCEYLLTQDDLEIKYRLIDKCNKFKLGQTLTLKGE